MVPPTTTAANDPTLGPFVSTGTDILVVDDVPANLVAIEAALSPLGRRVVVVESGAQALARLLEQDFILIILDVLMPIMSGLETARLIRARPRSRGTPIIFITARDQDPQTTLSAYAIGAVDFIHKPVLPEILRAKAEVFIALEERTMELHRNGEQLRLALQRDHERELAEQRHRAEAEILSARAEKFQELNRRKDVFMAVLGHELRNPMQTLRTALDMMKQFQDQPVTPRAREVMERCLWRLERVLDDLLDVARLTANKLVLKRERLHIAEVIREALDGLHGAIEASRHDIRVELDDSLEAEVDHLRLVQVVSNLVANAVKYTDPGGSIAVTCAKDRDRIRMTVRDTGRGIRREILPTIFEMFVQERVGSDDSSGLGVGLALVKHLVELHGGEVRADSDGPGRGTTFEIWLPLAAAVTAAPRSDRPAISP